MSKLVSTQGFTLIEMLVVVAIIGILVSTAMPDVTGALCDGKAAGVELDLTTIRTAYVQCYIGGTGDCDDIQTLVDQKLLPERILDDFSNGSNKFVAHGPNCLRGTWHTRNHYQDGTGQCIALDLQMLVPVRHPCPSNP